MDYYIGAPNQQVFRTDLLETPIIRMYGVTEHGGLLFSQIPCAQADLLDSEFVMKHNHSCPSHQPGILNGGFGC